MSHHVRRAPGLPRSAGAFPAMPSATSVARNRKNDTHSSTTDPDARLFRKGAGKEAKLCHMGHLMMENHNGLIIDARLTEANGTAELCS
jgi:hypothetical protein